MNARERLMQVVAQMPDDEAEATLARIHARRSDPFLRYLDAAPIDDEPLTPEEEAAIAAGRADAAAGRVVSFDDLKRELEL
jgi:predicted transcriptional regulator